MVDCRPAAGAPPHELAPNGAPQPPPENNHHNMNNQVGAGDSGSHGSPAARASTPAASTMTAYAGGPGMSNMSPMSPLACGGYYYNPAAAGAPNKVGGGVLWVPPPPPPPPPHTVNIHVYKSMQPNGSDLPMNDIPTLRYYFNLGVDCMWGAYGPPPPRHYPPRDVAQDMQHMSLQDRSHQEMHNKHKPQDKATPNQNKGNGQRSLLGPRFNKRGNQDGNQNPNQNKGINNNNMNNKGPNNRRNSHESRGGAGPPAPGVGHYAPEECPVEGPLMGVPYIPYPPPVYPVHYYPLETEPGMLGMMGGMGYVNYEEGGEFVQTGAFYPPPLYPAPHPPHAPHPPPPPPPQHLVHMPHVTHPEHK